MKIKEALQQSKKYDNYIYLGNRKAFEAHNGWIGWLKETGTDIGMNPVSLNDILSDKWETKQKTIKVIGWIGYFLASNGEIFISKVCKTEQEAKDFYKTLALLGTKTINFEIKRQIK